MAEHEYFMVLAAGTEQIPAILKAKELGYRVVAVDFNPKSPGFQYADISYPVNIRDLEGCLAVARQHNIVGLLAPATDLSQPAAEYISRMLNLPQQLSIDGVRASIDKGFFVQKMQENGIRVPCQFQSRELDEAQRSITAMSMPLIVKPADAGGSKGVTLIHTPAELSAAFSKARGFSFSGTVCIEEYIEGRQYSSEIFVVGGKVQLVANSQKINTPPPLFVAIQHCIPAPLPTVLERKLTETYQRIVDILHIESGPINFDLIIRDEEIVFIEMGMRLAANAMPQLVKQAFGVDTTKAAIELAVGKTPDLSNKQQGMALAQILISDRGGVLRDVRGLDEIRQLPGVHELRFYYKPGDRIHRFTQGAERLGYVVLNIKDYPEGERLVHQILQTLQLDIEPNNEKECMNDEQVS